MSVRAPSSKLGEWPRLAHPDFTQYDAVLFDLDGVLTAICGDARRSAGSARSTGLFAEHEQEPFDLERDYVAHVDGKPRPRRRAGPASRPRGLDAGDEQGRPIVADRKQALVERALALYGRPGLPRFRALGVGICAKPAS